MKYLHIYLTILILWLSYSARVDCQQINISRIESMPKMPTPYLMREWKEVAIGYDSLVFDFDRDGDYLPLIFTRTNTVNYPNQNSFGLHTVVGTNSPQSGEAINCIPAVIGATLVGIDKKNQNGIDYVAMCKEWFNKRPEQNVYKNHPVDDTYDDWWYETMPNIFFYQLYSLYPETTDFKEQFLSVADQWFRTVEVMNGRTTPWNVPYMNYRGFDLSKMLPYATGVKEPEAAGALAWIFYNAYSYTKIEKYRIGAELCMEYLNSLISNPSYELQLAYGVYIAARMNAELGTNYNVEKMMNWCFDVGPLRNWGSVVGTWGGYDVSGLIGEVNGSNDYPFSMNTFEQIGALVPLAKYDDRFARAIGKWVLNAANASRLFYTNYLPYNNQDSEEWGRVYDPKSYLAHEAIRQEKYGQRPYATGDAIDGGWGATNYTLYSSSHVGILGGIIDTTNVSMILKLDLNKTDYFKKSSFPTFLFYNPYDVDKIVEIETGTGLHNLYDAVSNSLILSGVSGKVQIQIPADQARVIVIIPSTGNVTYDLNKTSVDNEVIDYSNGQVVSNYPPRIKSLASKTMVVLVGESVNIFCTAEDREDKDLNYSWSAAGGILSKDSSIVVWTAPNATGKYKITCIVTDNQVSADTSSIMIEVVELINNLPKINSIKAKPRKIDLNSTSIITGSAFDEDGDSLSFFWSSNFGTISGTDSVIIWTAPGTPGNYWIKCSVQDIHDGKAEDSVQVSVRDFSQTQSGNQILYLPFTGNANDSSGNSFNGVVSGASLFTDRFGNGTSAYYFDGVNDNISIPNNSSLNFKNAITVCFWMNVFEFYDREAYPISHGNWENRWKISITNKRVRWTVKTSSGIKDIDSETELIKNKYYFVTCIYSGDDYEIYLNDELDAFTIFSGAINSTSYALTIGQVLPGNNQYNFKGVLDDIRIYDYAVSYPEILKLYDFPSSANVNDTPQIPKENFLSQNYPNPFNAQTIIRYNITQPTYITIEVYNSIGNKIKTLVSEEKPTGYYSASWDGTNSAGHQAASGVYFCTMKLDNVIFTRKLILLK
ncbi:MAG: LamG-like jellyroll fold domain-containing protein [Bacteroidota bacterium]